MSKSRRTRTGGNHNPARHISIRAVRRHPPDLRKLSRAVITLAMAEAAASQAHTAQHDDAATPRQTPGVPDD